MSSSDIYYSDKYYDDLYEYRHVILPKEISRKDPRSRLLSEDEWRALGIQMSVGWIHYHRHSPEPCVLLFRREHHGNVPAEVQR
jgi:cyclin-dependent kinase regulatory subunit CKS1